MLFIGYPVGFYITILLQVVFLFLGILLFPIGYSSKHSSCFSIAFIYWAFREKMKPLTGFVFLIIMFIFALLDVYKYYSFQLCSENLGLFTVSLFVYFVIKGTEKNKLSLQICASFFLVLSVLTRPNIFPFGIAFIIIPTYILFAL